MLIRFRIRKVKRKTIRSMRYSVSGGASLSEGLRLSQGRFQQAWQEIQG